MPFARLHRCALPLVLTSLGLLMVPGARSQVQTSITTAKGRMTAPAVPHPLSWWTTNPLRLDSSGDLMVGATASDGKPIQATDYRVRQQVTPLGVLAGHRILDVLTTIRPGPRMVASGWAAADGPPIQWKSLLVQAGPDGNGAGNGAGSATRPADDYVEIYRLEADPGLYMPLKPAALYGTGPDAILGTYDPDTGNGGGCDEGYWSFDASGPHPVDFTLLDFAIGQAVPPHTTYTLGCWAMHPERSIIESGVQRANAECHACGWVGRLSVRYRIEHGRALPVEVHFTPDSDDAVQ